MAKMNYTKANKRQKIEFDDFCDDRKSSYARWGDKWLEKKVKEEHLRKERRKQKSR